MSFDLKLDFTGLCLFVPDAGGEAPRVHVLMPNMRAEPGDAAALSPHAAWLVFDRAYLREGSTELEGRYEAVQLTRGAIEIAGHGGTALRPEVPDVFEIAGRKPDPALLADDPGGQLAARLTLEGGTIREMPSGTWRIGSVPPSLSAAREWTVVCNQPALRLEVKPLAGDAEPLPIQPLYPIGGTVQLRVLHIPSDQAPDTVVADEPGGVGQHFAAYYGLFPGSSDVIPSVEKKEEEQ